MRWMLIVTAALAVAYAGFWFMGREDRKVALEIIGGRLANGGIETSHSAMVIRGFPSRHDVHAENLSFTGRVWRWNLPELEAASLSYRPGEVIVTFPPEQTLTVGPVMMRLEAEELRARMTFTANGEMIAMTVEGDGLTGDLLSAERLLFAMRQTEGTRYEIYLELSQAQTAVTTIDSARASGGIAFAAPLDQMALETFPAVTEFTLGGPGAEAVKNALPPPLR